MAEINAAAEDRKPIGSLRIKVIPDLDGFTEALEDGLRDVEDSASPLIAILTRIEDHLRVIADAHRPIGIAPLHFRTPKEN